MLRPMLAFVVTTPFAVAATLAAPTSASAPPEPSAVEADHTLVVSASHATDPSVSSYPEFDPEIDRYAVVGGEGKQIRVQATTSDPAGTVLVNGVPRGRSADVAVTGVGGQEISVIFEDADATEAHSLFVTPTGFPTLAVETPVPDAELTPGQVLLTLSDFAGGPFFETAVDRRGVPTHVHRSERMSIDLKRQPDGRLTAHRQSSDDAPLSGAPVVVLDDQWQPTGAPRRTVGLVNTDQHDSILNLDGSRIMLAYEPRGQWIDAVAQEINSDGGVEFTWNSGDDESGVDRTTDSLFPDDPDYAHVNSVDVMDDGHWLLSFRHLSTVLKIARYDDGVHQAGDVIWRLGGRRSDFEFIHDADGGPCAQHAASELPNGNILIFDNGGGELKVPNGSGGMTTTPSLCIDPADPTGAPVDRRQTRITEYALDETAGTATLVSSFEPEGRFAYFAGGVEQLPNGHRIIGWASSKEEIATELDADKQTTLWTLRDAQPIADRLFTYRADVTEIPDAIAPEVEFHVPVTVLQGSTVRNAWSATDRGGSNLVAATTVGASNGLLDTSTPGPHALTVTAVDGAGNETTTSLNYLVAARSHQPDAMVRSDKPGWHGLQSYGAPKRQQATLELRGKADRGTAKVKVVNRGNVPSRFRITGADSTRWFKVTYRQGGRNVTGKMTGKGLRTPVLAPGDSWTGKVLVRRLRGTGNGKQSRFVVRARAEDRPSQQDAVRLRARARP